MTVTTTPVDSASFPDWHPLKGIVKVWVRGLPNQYYAYGDTFEEAVATLVKYYPQFKCPTDDNPRHFSCGL